MDQITRIAKIINTEPEFLRETAIYGSLIEVFNINNNKSYVYDYRTDKLEMTTIKDKIKLTEKKKPYKYGIGYGKKGGTRGCQRNRRMR